MNQEYQHLEKLEKLERILKEQRMDWHWVVNELANGRKESHWCWYFFPNVPGLGQSDKAKSFAVTPEEFLFFMQYGEYAGNISAIIYLVDRAVAEYKDRDLLYILGDNSVDVLKFRSFMTLVRGLWCRGELYFSDKIASIIQMSGVTYGVCEHTADYLNVDYGIANFV